MVMRRTSTLLNNMEDLAGTMAARSKPYLCFVANVIDANSVAIYRFAEEIDDAFEALVVRGFDMVPDDVVVVVDIGRQPVVMGVVGDIGGSSGSGFGAPAAADYTILTPSLGHYVAYSRTGVVAYDRTDTATTSALKFIVETVTQSYSHIHFGPGLFNLLDAPLGTESWANTETKMSFVDKRGVLFTGEGMYSTRLSVRTNTIIPSPDVATTLFTRCMGWTMRDMTVDQCGCMVTTMEPINGNQAVDFSFERVRVTRAKSRGFVLDGGDTGAYAGRNIIHACLVQGRPRPCELNLVAGGSLPASTTHRYCATWEDPDLLGANVAGETMPSEVTELDTSVGSKTIRVQIDTGPASCTARHVYRWTAAVGWLHVQRIADNTTTSWDDTGTATTASVGTVFTDHRSTIPYAGYEILSSSDSTISDSIADGTGDRQVGGNQYGFNIARKATHQVPNRNRVHDCIAIGTGAAGFRVFGGSGNIFSGCTSVNPGSVASRAQFFRVEGSLDTPTDNNIFIGIRGVDTQTADSPSGGSTVGNQMSIVASTFVPNGTIIVGESFSGGLAGLANGGTNTKQYADLLHTHTGLGALVVAEPRFINGSIYGPRTDLPYSALTTFVLNADTIYGVPFYATQPDTIGTLGLEITATGTATKVRLGIYDANETNGLGDVSRWLSPADISATTIGFKTDTPAFAVDAEKRYWLACMFDGTVTVRGFQPTISLLGYSAIGDATKRNGLLKVVGAGWTTMPTNFPAAPSFTNNVTMIDVVIT